eukprot:6491482-Amphidinium_carterae.1
MLHEHCDHEEVKRVERAANLWVVKALDHALTVGLGRGLQAFVVSQPLEKLEKGHRRFKVQPGPTVPPELFNGGQAFRWAVLDEGTKRTRIELTSRAPPSIHICTDQGTVGYQAGFWMMQAAGMSCTWKGDIHHRIYNDVKAAVKTSKLLLPQLAASAVFNLGAGPWANNAYQNIISSAAREYFSIASVDEPLFQMHFDLLARDLTDGVTKETRSHMESVLEQMKACSALWNCGASTRSFRWFAWFDKAADYMVGWHTVLLVLSYYCAKQGWIEKRSDLPILRGCTLGEILAGEVKVAEDHSERLADVSSKPSSSTDALKQMTEVVEGGGRKSRHKLHMAALLMGNTHVRNQVCMMSELVKPLRRYHGELVLKLRSPAGSCEHAILEAGANWEHPLAEVFGLLESENSLSWMGFKVGERSVVEQDEEEELALARDALSFATALVSERIVQSLAASFSLPQRMAPLLSTVESERQQTLECMKRWFEVLLDLEAKALESKALQDVHWEQIWANSHFCRWLLFSLSECNFERVPESVHEALQHHFSGIHHTQGVEDMFHYIREEESRSPNHQIHRMKRWSVCTRQGIREDRPAVKSLPTHACQHKALPKSLFTADSEQGGSLDAEHALRLCNEWWWYSPNPTNQSLIPLTWMSVLLLWPDQTALDCAWRSLLCVPGTMIRHREKNAGGLVLKVSPFGVIIWKVKRYGSSSQGYRWTLVASASQISPWQFVTVTDLSEWEALAVRALPPRVVQQNPCPNQPGHAHIALVSDGPRLPLLQMAAQHCFPGMTTPWLRKLLLSSSVGASKAPRLEKECLAALLQHCLPEHTQADIDEILAKRGSYHRSSAEPSGVDAAVTADFESILEEDELSMLRIEVRKHRERREVKDPAQQMEPNTKRKPLPALPEGRTCYTLEELRSLIPKVAGCKLTVETHWHTRYRGHYVKGAPKSTSKCWGEHVTEHQAAMFVVQWLWSRHKQMTGEDSPYEFDV